MPSVSDDFQMPIMYQDLRNPNLGMLGMPYPYLGNTNYLGGVRMQPILTNDEVIFSKKKKEKWNNLKTVALVIAGIASIGLLKGKGVFGWMGKQCTNVGNWFKNLFKKTPTPPAAGTP